LALGYIKTIAVNIVHDHFRSALAAARGARAEQIEQDLILDDSSGIERKLTIDQIEKVLTEVTAGDDQEKQRTIFWLYYRQGVTAKPIAAIPTIGLKPRQVETTIINLTKKICDHVKREDQVKGATQSKKKSNRDRKGNR
jgi:RNA polymerase sigma-70 factor, ECF subfamily